MVVPFTWKILIDRFPRRNTSKLQTPRQLDGQWHSAAHVVAQTTRGKSRVGAPVLSAVGWATMLSKLATQMQDQPLL